MICQLCNAHKKGKSLARTPFSAVRIILQIWPPTFQHFNDNNFQQNEKDRSSGHKYLKDSCPILPQGLSMFSTYVPHPSSPEQLLL